MLRFREELNKIKKVDGKKVSEEQKYEENVEKILKQILEYYANQEIISPTDAKEINCKLDDMNRIIVKIFDLDDEEGKYEYIISCNIKSRIEAKETLVLLCNVFKWNSYRIMFGKTVERDDEFSVLID